jgi:hypothetical protein
VIEMTRVPRHRRNHRGGLYPLELSTWRSRRDGGTAGLWVTWESHPGEASVELGIGPWAVRLWWLKSWRRP